MIRWRDQMSVGNLIIDQDHRYLISLINIIELLLKQDDSTEQLQDVLGQLAEYAREHFKREEAIQYSIRYAHMYDHKLSHQRLASRLEDITRTVLAEQDEKVRQRKADDTVQLLREWLIDHVLKDDMRMKADLVRHPANIMG
jgi:hemerythrin